MAVQLAELRRSGWPGEREGLWIAEADGQAVGGVTLRDLGGGLAGSAISRCSRRRAARAPGGGSWRACSRRRARRATSGWS